MDFIKKGFFAGPVPASLGKIAENGFPMDSRINLGMHLLFLKFILILDMRLCERSEAISKSKVIILLPTIDGFD